jgi:predicted DNA-binding protein YlxM (UPF0122 family)
MNREKDYNISLLADIYGGLLTQKQLNILRDYYDYDYSLAELSEKYGITRQTAYGCINSAKKSLIKFENEMEVLCRQKQLGEYLNELEKSGISESGKQIIKKIKDSLFRQPEQ